MKYPFFLLTPLTLFFFTALQAQDTTTVHFDKDGKIHGDLPERINKTTDKVNFELDDPKESFADFSKQLTNRLSSAQARLTKLNADASSMKILTDIFNISPADIDAVIAELKAVYANPVDNIDAQPPTYTPEFKQIATTYVTVSTEHLTNAQPLTFAPNAASTVLPLSMSASDYEFDFTLIKTDPFKDLIFGWYSDTRQRYGDHVDFALFLQTEQPLKGLMSRANAFLVPFQKGLSELKDKNASIQFKFYQSVRDTAQQLADEINGVDTSLKESIKLPGLRSWILEWLWYQSALLPTINPFSFRDPADFGDAPDTSALPAIRGEIIAREAMLQNTSLVKMAEQDLQNFVARDVALRKQVDSMQRVAAKYKNDTAKNDKQEEDFCTTKSQLNQGMLFAGSKEKQLYWMRHHDASRNYMLMDPAGAEEYLETDKVIILAHNLKPTQSANVHLTFANITNDESKFAETVQPVADSLKNAATAIGSFAASSKTNSVNIMKTAAADAIANLQRAIRDAQALAADLDYLAGQSNPDLKLTAKTGQTASFHSQVANPPKKTDGPKKATYYFTTDTVSGATSSTTNSSSGSTTAKSSASAADTFTYRINKLYRLFPMGGVFYTVNTFSTIGMDSATKQSTVTSGTHTAYIVGLKAYIKKTDIRNSSIFWKKDSHDDPLWPTRLSVDLAFDVSAPLNNLYIGPALDIWPGVTLNLGTVFNRYTYNTYNNGILTDSRKLYRPGFFMGLSTDLSLCTDMGKFFNLSK